MKRNTFPHNLLLLKTDEKYHKILTGQNSKTNILQNNLHAISECLSLENGNKKNSAIIFRGLCHLVKKEKNK